MKVKSKSSYEGTKKMVGAGSVPSLDTSTKHIQEFKTPSYLFLLTHAINL
jgi:hypothetical protein